MKRTVAFAIALELVLACLSACSCAGQSGAQLVWSEGEIGNPDFTEGLTSWSVAGSATAGDGVLTIDCDGETTVRQGVKGLAPGYYCLQAEILNDGGQEWRYLYANGTAQGRCMTSAPVTRNGEWRTVTVRGIEVGDDGKLEVGVCVKGSDGQRLCVDSVSLTREQDQQKQYEHLFGGAISWLNWEEDMGAQYFRADGTRGDALQIMAESGCNFVRLELYNNPGHYANELGDRFPEGYKDADDIFDLASRADAKGMSIQLSFMYADYWGNDALPTDWVEAISGLEDEAEIADTLTKCLYTYTKGFMQRLADAGIYPEYISLGNEMQGGILLPYGNSYESPRSVETFAGLLNAGYDAVKEVSPDSQVVLHMSCNADDMFWSSGRGTGVWFCDLCGQNGIRFDVIGLSYYPFWAQTDSRYALKPALDCDDLVEWCNMMVGRYDKDILIMETGYNWGKPGQLANNGAYGAIYPSTRRGQADFMIELINAVKTVDDGRCKGDLYWDPILVRQKGIGYAIREDGTPRENCVETTTFFDFSHTALPVLDAYRYNAAGDDCAALCGTITVNGTAARRGSFEISVGEKVYSVTTDDLGGYYLRLPLETTGATSVACSTGGISAGADAELWYGMNARVDFAL